MGNMYFYARVSTLEQSLDRQLIAAKERGVPCGNIFTEKLSGKNTKRPVLQRLMARVKRGDAVIVESFSRFSRSTRDLLDLVDKLTKKGVEFISLKESIDTSTPAGKLMLTVFAALYEFERDCTLVRQAEGISAAKTRGAHLGRPIKEPPENFAEVVKEWERRNIGFDDVLRLTGLKQATFYNRLREFRQGNKKQGL